MKNIKKLGTCILIIIENLLIHAIHAMSFDKILKRNQQKNLKINYFKYIKNFDSKKIYNSPFRYPCTWYENLSKSFLNYLSKKK